MISDIKSKDLHETSLSRKYVVLSDLCCTACAWGQRPEGTERERWSKAVSEGSSRKPSLRLPPSMLLLSQQRCPLESRSSETGDGRNFVAFLAFKIRADGMRDEPC